MAPSLKGIYLTPSHLKHGGYLWSLIYLLITWWRRMGELFCASGGLTGWLCQPFVGMLMRLLLRLALLSSNHHYPVLCTLEWIGSIEIHHGGGGGTSLVSFYALSRVLHLRGDPGGFPGCVTVTLKVQQETNDDDAWWWWWKMRATLPPVVCGPQYILSLALSLSLVRRRTIRILLHLRASSIHFLLLILSVPRRVCGDSWGN